jgi:hypothetical protein
VEVLPDGKFDVPGGDIDDYDFGDDEVPQQNQDLKEDDHQVSEIAASPDN